MHDIQPSGSRLSGAGRTERWRPGLDAGDRGAEVLAALARADRARAAAELARLRRTSSTAGRSRRPIGRIVRQVVGTTLLRATDRLTGARDGAGVVEVRR